MTEPPCSECHDRGSGDPLAGCPTCGRIRPDEVHRHPQDWLDVEALHLEPGDVVVGTVPEHVNADQIAYVRRALELACPGHRAFVVQRGFDFRREAIADLVERAVAAMRRLDDVGAYEAALSEWDLDALATTALRAALRVEEGDPPVSTDDRRADAPAPRNAPTGPSSPGGEGRNV